MLSTASACRPILPNTMGTSGKLHPQSAERSSQDAQSQMDCTCKQYPKHADSATSCNHAAIYRERCTVRVSSRKSIASPLEAIIHEVHLPNRPVRRLQRCSKGRSRCLKKVERCTRGACLREACREARNSKVINSRLGGWLLPGRETPDLRAYDSRSHVLRYYIRTV
jgi:hypothetical protein